MKTLFILFILAGISIPVAKSQEKDKSVKNDRSSAIAARLGISQAKAKEAADALEYNREAIQQAESDASLRVPEKTKKLRTLQAERQTRIAAVLTVAQLEQLGSNSLALMQSKRDERKAAIKKQTDSLRKKETPAKTKP